LIDDNIDELKGMIKNLKQRLEEAVEDGIIDSRENDDILTRIKDIEMCILNDGKITKAERKIMKEAQDLFESYMKRAEMRLDK